MNVGSVVHIEGFVLELIRLHPPAKAIFGTATQDFTMESQSGKFG